MSEVLPVVNYWLLFFIGLIFLALQLLTQMHWLKIIGLSLLIVGAGTLVFDIQDGLFQLIWLLIMAFLLYQVGKNGRSKVWVADEHPEGGTGVISRVDGELKVIYKNKCWPIVTDEERLHPGDHVVVLEIIDDKATVELLSRKSVHAKN